MSLLVELDPMVFVAFLQTMCSREAVLTNSYILNTDHTEDLTESCLIVDGHRSWMVMDHGWSWVFDGHGSWMVMGRGESWVEDE